ncbi:MAG: choice-of-anchor L domain-containing protein [Lishizhenia sp.]
MKHILSILLSFLGFTTLSQITTTNTLTPEELVQQVLIGQGINAFNVTFNGAAANATFTNPSALEFSTPPGVFEFPSGVYLTTQSGAAVSDQDVQSLASNNATNGAVLEFDFIATGDTLSFNYHFASVEYGTYTCSNFNDVFGFFISGPGFNGPYQYNAENIALIPGGNTPVQINTVNSGIPGGAGTAANCAAADPNWLSNVIYYTESFSSLTGYPYNGGTIGLTANASLICGQTYHIKLGVANIVDTGLDSGVFLEANSFKTNAVDISIATTQNDTILIEGCTDGQVIFSRPENQATDSLTIFFTTGGDAIDGVDYPSVTNGDSVVFLPGQDSIVLLLSPIDDGLMEGPELLTISAFTVTICGDTIQTQGFTYILDEPFSEVTALDTTILCATNSVPINVSTSGGFGPYQYDWYSLPDSIYITTGDLVNLAGLNDGPQDYLVISTDACGFDYVDTATITVNQTLSIDEMVADTASCGLQDGLVYGIISGNTGQPDFNWTGPGSNSPFSIDASAWNNLVPGWYYFSVTDDICTTSDSIFLAMENPPTASFTANPTQGYAPLYVTFTNNSTPNADAYIWNFGNGTSNTVNNLSDQNSTYDETQEVYTVELIVNEGACSDTAYQTIFVTPFLPLNYQLPNVFTPGSSEGSNDVFKVSPENAESLDMIITNRWGNIVFESNGDPANAVWNGNNKNSGEPCIDGVYFYTFTIKGFQGEQIVEQGFVHLIRN